MKKYIVCVVLLCFVATMFSGCIQLSGTYELLHDPSDVDAVEIYYLEEDNDFELPLDAEPIKYLLREEAVDFCEDLEALQYTEVIILLPVTFDPSFSLYEYVVKVYYGNGDCEIIGNSGYQTQDTVNNRGKTYHYSFDDAAWDDLIEEYVS